MWAITKETYTLHPHFEEKKPFEIQGAVEAQVCVSSGKGEKTLLKLSPLPFKLLQKDLL